MSDNDPDYENLCQRLDAAHQNSAQTIYGSYIFGDASDAIRGQRGVIAMLWHRVAELESERADLRSERDRAYTQSADADARIAELEAENERLRSIANELAGPELDETVEDRTVKKSLPVQRPQP